MSIEALTVVLHHSRAKHSAKLVLLGIANHYHPDDERGAWPSQETLAHYANVTDRAVRKCIDDLVKLGELRVETHGGPTRGTHKPNRYWITLECPEDCDRSMNHRPKQQEQFDRATGTIQQSNRNNLTEQLEPQFRLTVIEPKENLKGTVSSEKTEFDEFWEIYPRKKDKPRARRAFEKALKRASLETILDGAKRHRDDPNREDRYTKYPEGWLNADAWDDPPEPPKQQPRRANWEDAADLARKYREQETAAIEYQNRETAEALEAEAITWLKGVDDD